jgi:hypothetical protein
MGGKIFASHISDKELVPQFIRNSQKSIVGKQTAQYKNEQEN